jgi:hypothetical protein
MFCLCIWSSWSGFCGVSVDWSFFFLLTPTIVLIFFMSCQCIWSPWSCFYGILVDWSFFLFLLTPTIVLIFLCFAYVFDHGVLVDWSFFLSFFLTPTIVLFGCVMLCWCSEENVYFLLKKLCKDGVADADGSDLFVVFISNDKKQAFFLVFIFLY